jgi:hypothetical protein
MISKDDGHSDQLELPIDGCDTMENNVKAFVPKKKPTTLPEAEEVEALIQDGFEFFVKELEDGAKGFFATVFDKDNNPRTIWAGDIGLVNSLGAMEVMKHELLSNVFSEE